MGDGASRIGRRRFVEGGFGLRIFERVKQRHAPRESGMSLRTAARLEIDLAELFQLVLVIVSGGFREEESGDEEQGVHGLHLRRSPLA